MKNVLMKQVLMKQGFMKKVSMEDSLIRHAARCLLASLALAAVSVPAIAQTVDYKVRETWNGGFVADAGIRNGGSSRIAGWKLEFDYPYTIREIWSARIVSRSGQRYALRGESWNVDIPASGRVDFGWVVDTSGDTTARPRNCRLNGTAIPDSRCAALVAGNPVAINGQLRVCGTRLCNQSGRAIQLRGMSTHGLQWSSKCLKDSAFDALARDWGADVVRLAMYVREGGYNTDPAGYKARMDAWIAEISSRGMYVIVDWHILTPGDPMADVGLAKDFFQYMSKKHGWRKNILYEIANEPNGVSWNRIRQYADTVIPIIRANDPDAVVLVGTRGWSSLGLSEGAGPEEIIANPVNASNIMYSFHFYAASHTDYHREGFARAIGRIPLFVTEFGTTAHTGNGDNDFASAQRYIDLMAQHKISWVNWAFSDHGQTSAAFIRNTCSTDGPWNGSVLTPSGAWARDKMRVPADSF